MILSWAGPAGLGGVFLFCLVFCLPSSSLAHLVTTGMGPVYDGIADLLMTPEDLIPVLTLALFAGLRGAHAGRRTMFLLPSAWLVGGAAGMVAGAAPAAPVPVISFLVLGGAVAADLRLPPMAVAILATAVGLGHGWLNGAALGNGPGVRGLAGAVIIVFLLVTLVSALIVTAEKSWMRVATRVVGSWVAAGGVLMLGWLARGAV